MIKKIILLSGILCALPSYGVSQMDGRKLLEICQDAKKLLANQSQDANIQLASNSSLCLGYLTGFEDMHYITSAAAAGVPQHYDMSKQAQYYCMPAEVSLRDQVELVVRYLNKHPAALNKSAPVVLFGLFKQTYPCASAAQH